MAINTPIQRMAIAQLGGKRQFLAVPSGAFQSHDRLMLIKLYPLTVATGTSTRRRLIGRWWFRNQN